MSMLYPLGRMQGSSFEQFHLPWDEIGPRVMKVKVYRRQTDVPVHKTDHRQSKKDNLIFQIK